MIVKEIIERIEGEAELDFTYKNGIIENVKIKFPHFRGMEHIIEGKSAMDALVITPRVCGICGHAHLIAATRAMEDLYKNSSNDIEITKKASDIREITLNCEIIQNHIKWFYFVMYPLIRSIQKGSQEFISLKNKKFFEAQKAVVQISKIIALFGGQWPHTSYALPGGVMCDPTYVEIVQALSFLDEVYGFFEKNIFSDGVEAFLSCSNSELISKDGDISLFVKNAYEQSYEKIGRSYDRFIVFGENSLFKSGKVLTTIVYPVKTKYVTEKTQTFTYSKNVYYKDKFYETGPLARQMLLKQPLVREFHRKLKDSAITRIVARVAETALLLQKTRDLLKCLDIDAPSYIRPKKNIHKISGSGIGVVEAARGSLIHKIEIKEGLVKKYEIITPTQWNLGNGTKKCPGVAQKAMIGLKDKKLAEFVFRSFDICSVCTTH
ncbi:nickel-dependent hydrogenase large subunit [Nitrosophilus alvini]|uniref:nickel-dependent hydrogenase large subunit n=1 Tax=Nitrosophilus alvini TaxID=2714855 RepID=UPI001F2FFE9B|nr:nickel-dependent hydrogenase large subunit [Nitrosophilus alvini]